MKRYEEAVMKIGQIDQLGHISEEIKKWTVPDADPVQAAIHLLSEAKECLGEWTKEASFAEDVYQISRSVHYSDLDLFEKAIYHILSIAPLQDGKFNISNAELDFKLPTEKWQHRKFEKTKCPCCQGEGRIPNLEIYEREFDRHDNGTLSNDNIETIAMTLACANQPICGACNGTGSIVC